MECLKQHKFAGREGGLAPANPSQKFQRSMECLKQHKFAGREGGLAPAQSADGASDAEQESSIAVWLKRRADLSKPKIKAA
jgi:hypothetical protein